MEDQTSAPTGTAGDPNFAPVSSTGDAPPAPEPLTGGPATTMPPQESPIPAAEAPAEAIPPAPAPVATKPPLEDLDDDEDAEIPDDAVVRMPFAFVRQMARVHLLSSSERRELARGIRASLPPALVAKLD